MCGTEDAPLGVNLVEENVLFHLFLPALCFLFILSFLAESAEVLFLYRKVD